MAAPVTASKVRRFSPVIASKVRRFSPEQDYALSIARSLASAGVRLFVAQPAIGRDGRWDPCGGHNGCGFWLPPWKTGASSNPRMVDTWQPGTALCAVGGTLCDFIDVDPRSGGLNSYQELAAQGHWPMVYGRQATPSEGWHDLIAPLGVGSKDAIAPGLDFKGGKPDGESRGFIFLAPTVKLSKTQGYPLPYRWISPPNISALQNAAVQA
jgi:hypothetical protein